VRVKLAPFLNVEQLLAQMSPEELEKVQKQAKEYIARGGGSERGAKAGPDKARLAHTGAG